MRLIISMAIVTRCVAMNSIGAAQTTDRPSTSGLHLKGSAGRHGSAEHSHVKVDGQKHPGSFIVRSEDQRQQALELLIELINDFSAKFLGILAEDITETCVQSPVLSFLSLSMMYWETDGSTRTMLMQTLGLSMHDPQMIRLGLQTLIDNLGQNHSDIELRVNNKIFLPSGISLDPDYIELIKEFYRASVFNANSPPPTGTTNAIGTFLTKIRQRLSQNRFYTTLTSSIDFRGTWAIQFDTSRTELRKFYVYGNAPVDAPTMYANGMFRYGKIKKDRLTFIEVPYKSKSGISLFIIRPNSRHPAVYEQLVKGLSKIDISKLLKYEKKRVELYLPKFEITTNFLSSEWVAPFFGSKNLFESEDDLSEMLPSTGLKFKDIRNEVALAINEQGGSTSGSSAIYHKSRKTRSPDSSPVETFDVNVPFVGIVATTDPKSIIKLLYITVSGGEFLARKP